MEIRAIVDCKTSLGEGPLWDVQDQKLYWIDSLGNKVFRANADGSNVSVWDVPSKIGSMAARRSASSGALKMSRTTILSISISPSSKYQSSGS